MAYDHGKMLGWILACGLALLTLVSAEDYTNPIRNGTDPFVVWDNSTKSYYFLTTPGNQLHITAAPTLNKLKTAEKVMVFQNQEMKDKKTAVWAPEIHNLGGKWYLYYTFDSLSYVLTGGAKPLDPYTNPVQLSSDYGIDGTVLNVKNQAYYVWSCRRPMADTNIAEQSLCISKLITPTQIDKANIVTISQPTEAWERFGRPLNEGPQPLYWQGETYLVFSGSFCFSAEYSLGLLHLTGDDPMNKALWKKLPGPVFTKANGEFSTGHNGIFVSPDGTELWNVFHASNLPEGSCGTDRETFAMKIDTSNFKVDGPKFGVVQAPGAKLKGPSGEDGGVTIGTAAPLGPSKLGPSSVGAAPPAIPPVVPPPGPPRNSNKVTAPTTTNPPAAVVPTIQTVVTTAGAVPSPVVSAQAPRHNGEKKTFRIPRNVRRA